MTKSLALALVGGGMFLSVANAGTFYNSLPATIPVDSAFSLGYKATSTSQFGDLITTAGGTLNEGVVLLSNWAYESKYDPLDLSPAGYDVPVTLTLYDVGAGNSVGVAITSSTTDVLVPWRPEPDPGACSSQNAVDDKANTGQPYLAGTGSCYSGASVEAIFDFSSVSLAPGNLIYGVSFATPNGSPTDSLNLAFTTDDPSVGSNPFPDTGYLDSTNAAIYADGGAGGTGTFRQDQNYSCANNQICTVGNFSGAVELSDAPEPGSVSMILIGLAGIGWGRFRKKSAA